MLAFLLEPGSVERELMFAASSMLEQQFQG